MTDRIAMAARYDFPDGRCLWVPPTGRPYWVHCNPAVDATDDELRAIGFPVQKEGGG